MATSYQRRHLQTATADQLNALYEIILNVLNENIPLSDEDYNRLYRHKNVLRKLAQKRIDPYSKKELISKHSLPIKDLLCVFFNYYPSFEELSTEKEEEEEEEDQNSLDTYDGERKWVPEVNFDSRLSLPTASAIPEQDKRESAN